MLTSVLAERRTFQNPKFDSIRLLKTIENGRQLELAAPLFDRQVARYGAIVTVQGTDAVQAKGSTCDGWCGPASRTIWVEKQRS